MAELAKKGECPWFPVGGPFWPIDGRDIEVLLPNGVIFKACFECHDGVSWYNIGNNRGGALVTHWRYRPESIPENPSFNPFCANVHEDAVEKGWWDEGERPFGEIIALCHAELSEALEEARDGRGYREIYSRGDGKPEGIPVELADVIIRIADFCGQAGIDLDHAIKIKREYNRTRPRRHGKAF